MNGVPREFSSLSGVNLRAKTSMEDTEQHTRPSFPVTLFKRTAATEKDLKWYPLFSALELDRRKRMEMKSRHRAHLAGWLRHLGRRTQLADY